MTWQRGCDDIDRLLAAGELEQVTPSPDVADRLLADAEAHIGLAAHGTDSDPAGALQLSYDAARKAAAALLATQGLRATTRGGHIAVLEAARAQFNDKGGVAVFGQINRVRRRRHDSEYPLGGHPGHHRSGRDTSPDHRPGRLDAARAIIATGKLGLFQ